MPKTVIFDLNGVFIKSPKLSERFRDDLSVPEGGLGIKSFLFDCIIKT